jgi:hypothetical protein
MRSCKDFFNFSEKAPCTGMSPQLDDEGGNKRGNKKRRARQELFSSCGCRRQ